MAYSASLTKTLSQIGRLEQSIDRLAQLPRSVSEMSAPAINRLIRQQFEQGKNPYGRTWAPLKPSTLVKGRKPPPLTDTGALKKGTKVYVLRANYAGLRIVVGEPYGYFHQMGTRDMSRRKILPDQGLPREWIRILNESATRIAKGGR